MLKNFLRSTLFGLTEGLLRISITVFFKVLFFLQGTPDTTPMLKKVSRLYKSGDFSELFTQIRLWDAPLVEIEKRVPRQGTVLDLGCGDGFLANFLAISEPGRKVIGIELNKERIKEVNKGLKNTKLKSGDILKERFPQSDAILLVHVLHHLPSFEAQKEVLNKCYKNLKKNGKLIIVEIGKKPLDKYLFSWLTDAIVVPILFEKKFFSKDFHYRDEKEWSRTLREYGFRVSQKTAHEGMPFSHVIFLCEKL